MKHNSPVNQDMCLGMDQSDFYIGTQKFTAELQNCHSGLVDGSTYLTYYA